GLPREERFRRARVILLNQQRMNQAYNEAKRRGVGPVLTPIGPNARGEFARTPTPSPTAPPAGNTLSATTRTTANGKNSGLNLENGIPPRATLYLDPAGRTIRTGEIFATQVRLLNNEKLAMDALHLVLSYPAKNLKPIAIHQNALLKVMRGEP